jgi:hypothetical protein
VGRLFPMQATSRAMVGAASRGAVASMAMTGFRALTTDVGLVDKTPPEVVGEHASRLIDRLPAERRAAAVVVMHWAYGALGGAAFGMLPRRLRRQMWVGPLYGALAWAGFEIGLAALTDSDAHAERRPVAARAAIAADHVLYGVIVASSSWAHER